MINKFNLRQGIKKYYPLGFLFILIFGFVLIQEVKAKEISVGTASDNIGIGTSAPGTTYRLNVNGNSNITGTLNVTGGITGGSLSTTYLSAGNVSAGVFGSNSGGGNYSFPSNVTAERFKGNNSLVLNTYATVNPASNVFLYSQPNDRDSWIYLDSADGSSNWGIYHRQIDSAVSNLPANSIGFVGGGASALQAYISLANGNAYFAGSVGIGTTGPGGKLEVDGSAGGTIPLIVKANTGANAIYVKGRSDNLGYLEFIQNNGTTLEGAIYGSSGRMTLTDSASADVLTIKSGSVGIGTTNPSTRLETKGVNLGANIAGSVIRASVTDGVGSLNFGYGFYIDNAAYDLAQILAGYDTSTSGGTGHLSFNTRQAGTLSTQMTILGSGNVGIGTTDPQVRLDVQGNTNAYGANVYGMWTPDGNSLIRNWALNDGTNNYGSAGQGAYTTISDAPMGSKTMRYSSPTDWRNQQWIPVDITKTYKVSFWGRTISGTPQNYISLTQAPSDLSTPVNGGWGNPYWGRVNEAFPTTWTYYSMTIGPSGSGTNYAWNSDTKYVQLGALMIYTGSGVCELTGYKIEEVPSTIAAGTTALGNLTVTGTISGAMSGTLNSANVSAGTFGANTGGGNYSFSGNVGIGTADYSTGALHVQNSGGNGGILYSVFLGQNSTGYQNALNVRVADFITDLGADVLGTNYGSNLTLSTRSSGGALTERLRVNNLGNVGIGNTGSQHQLAVGSATGDAQAVTIRGYSNTPISWKGSGAFGYTSASVIMGELSGVAQIGGHNATLSAWGNLAINSGGGNVGIGTSAPGHTLEVWGGANVAAFYSSASAAYIRLAVNNDLAQRIELANRGGRTALWNPQTADAFNVLNNGNVGIGTTAPGSKLEIYGSSVAGDETGTLKLKSSTLGQFMYMGYSDTNTAGYIQVVKPGTSQQSLLLNPVGGNVGIGATNPSAKLDVRNETLNNTAFQTLATVFANVSNESSGESFDPAMSSFGLSFRRNWAGSAGSTNVAGIYGFSSGGWRGGMVFRTKNNTNSAGDTDINAMVLSPAGNVGIGTTDPGAYKLYVNGNTNINGNLTITGSISGTVSNADTVDGWHRDDIRAWGNLTGKPTLPSSQEGSRYTTDYNSIIATGFFNGEATPANAPNNYGQLISVRGIDTGLQIAGGYDADNLYFRGWWSSGAGFSPWRTIIHSGNIGSQSVNYASTAGSASSANQVTGNNVAFKVTSGDGNGLKFWDGSDSFKISMGNGSLYQYGPVTDYSIKTQIDGTTGRGFTWGANGTAPIAGLNSTSGNMQIAGTMTSAGFIYNSDIKLKKNINTIDNSLVKILQLRGVTFNWKKDNTPGVGLIAQEVEKVFPELVSESGGIKSVQYGNLVAPLIEAVKEQQKEIQSLNERIKVLEAK